MQLELKRIELVTAADHPINSTTMHAAAPRIKITFNDRMNWKQCSGLLRHLLTCMSFGFETMDRWLFQQALFELAIRETFRPVPQQFSIRHSYDLSFGSVQAYREADVKGSMKK